MSQWTPGPWRHIAATIQLANGLNGDEIVQKGTGYVVATVERLTNPNADADGRLLAAAPEMAALLIALISDDVQADESVWPWQKDARAILVDNGLIEE